MKRLVLQDLLDWKKSDLRKPLIIRGARQVGKTYLVRELGRTFDDFIEINFEFTPELKNIFEHDLDPKRIIRDLSLAINKKIIPGQTLLFFDEIQEAPKAIASLRYFYENMYELHLVAAGSLIEFELENLGVPVGRIDFLYVYPLSFAEFLAAKGEGNILSYLIEHHPGTQVGEVVHNKCLLLLGEYLAIGGMPEVVNAWITYDDFKRCQNIHSSIIETYRQDFKKYVKKNQIRYVELLFDTIPLLIGQKFKYSNIPGSYKKRELLPALELLQKANIIHPVYHTKAKGIPLQSQIHPDIFKTIALDIALMQNQMDSNLTSWLLEPQVNFNNKGSVNEAFVGQEILAYSPSNKKAQLFYWQREKRSSNAEIDYIIQRKNTVTPIEVKSGSPGTLKSMHLFLKENSEVKYGIRFSSLNFNMDDRIKSFPLYSVFLLFEEMKKKILKIL